MNAGVSGFALILSIFLLPVFLNGQISEFPVHNKTLQLDKLKIGEGREVNLVYETLQDQYGFIWFGTFNGMVRYDGYHFTHYQPDKNDPSALKGKLVSDMMNDIHGNIWALTAEGGVHRYLQEAGSFELYTGLDGDSLLRSPRKASIRMITDSSGNVWMADEGGLLKFFLKEKGNGYSVKRYRCGRGEPNKNPGTVLSMLIGKRGTLYVAADKGLLYLDAAADTLAESGSGCVHAVTHLAESRSGHIVSGTTGEGLCVLDPSSGMVKHYQTDPADARSISGNDISDLVADGTGNIWLLAENRDLQAFILQRFLPEKGIFQTFFDPFAKPKPLSGSGLELLVDSKGFLWILASRELIEYDPYRESFKVFDLNNELMDYGFPINVFRDRTGVLWFGTFGDGVLRHAPSSHKFEIILPPRGDGEKRGIFVNHPLYEDSRGFLWSGTYYGTSRYVFDEFNNLEKIADYTFISQEFREDGNGNLYISTPEGIMCFDLNRSIFNKDLDLPFELPGVTSFSLIDDQGGFWFNSYGRGLFYFHLLSGNHSHYLHNPGQPGSISTNFLNPETIQDKDGVIWVSTGRGINKYNAEDQTFTNYLNEVQVMHIHEDKDGIFWLSTNGQGFYRFDKKSGASNRFDSNNGFPARTLFSLLEDDKGRFWIPSDVGLVHFDPVTGTSWLFDESDGIPSKYFAQSMPCKRTNGEMLFPLLDHGFVRFHPDSIKLDQHPPTPVITGFKLLSSKSEARVNEESAWTTDELLLKHYQNVFSIEYAGLHFAAPEINEYAYHLEGLDDTWHDVGNQRKVNFAGLGPGKYTFWLKAANPDGFWSREMPLLQITILPPWWATWWARCLYALFIGGILWLGYAFQKRRWQLKARLAYEYREARRLKELDEVKNRFYTNITHEFRTPLTIILGMADQLKDVTGKKLEESIRMIKRNGRNLLDLINQMLDLSKLESGSVPVDMVCSDILAYINYILESFHSLAESKGIRLVFKTDLDQQIMDYDLDKTLNIISNLVSNAIKFTGEGGDVEIEAETIKSGKIFPKSPVQDFLVLTVRDNGPGIPKEKLPYVFDRFYKTGYASGPSNDGSGIGLAVTKELVKILGGKIEVDSEPGKGTAFIVSLPITKNAGPAVDGLHDNELQFPDEEVSSFLVEDENLSPDNSLPLLLIVEDNADVVLYLRSILETGYRLEVAVDGKAGLERAIEIIPDIVISDVMMPVMDGYAFCSRLKNDIRTSHIPVILLTAKGDLPSKLEGFERGADAYLIKPFNKKELLIRLRKILEIRQRLLSRYRDQTELIPTEDPAFQMEDSFMREFLDLIESHFGNEHFGVPDLCDSMLMSRAQLYRKVSALTGKPPAAFLRSFRLRKARQMLLSNSLSISEIAFRVGFKDLAHFSRSFRKEYGVSPSETRT